MVKKNIKCIEVGKMQALLAGMLTKSLSKQIGYEEYLFADDSKLGDKKELTCEKSKLRGKILWHMKHR